MVDQQNPREQSGRDSFARYRMQIRSTAISALQLLESKDVDRVYCDLHDDMVVRVKVNDTYKYIFRQVKTKNKQNHNWTTNDLLNIPVNAKKLEKHKSKIKSSFLGKLIQHTVKFNESCSQVIFQTNINNSDSINDFHDDLTQSSFENKYVVFLLNEFNEIFLDKNDNPLSEDKIKENLSKLDFETDISYLKLNNDNFFSEAKEKIYKYSEIDLRRHEAEQILINLLELVSTKTEGEIDTWNISNIEKQAGISIEDLLDVLSISKEAYHRLINGQDELAVKNASIIQRILSKTNVEDALIAMCAGYKIDWDIWLRNNRHNITDLDLESIIDFIKINIDKELNGNSFGLNKLRKVAQQIMEDLKNNDLTFDLKEELIVGGIFSFLVKDQAWN